MPTVSIVLPQTQLANAASVKEKFSFANVDVPTHYCDSTQIPADPVRLSSSLSLADAEKQLRLRQGNCSTLDLFFANYQIARQRFALDNDPGSAQKGLNVAMAAHNSLADNYAKLVTSFDIEYLNSSGAKSKWITASPLEPDQRFPVCTFILHIVCFVGGVLDRLLAQGVNFTILLDVVINHFVPTQARTFTAGDIKCGHHLLYQLV